MKYLRTDEKAVKGSHLIYFGVCRDPVDENISHVILGKTSQSMQERYGKTCSAYVWYGFDLSGFSNYSKIDRLIKRTRALSNPKRGEQYTIKFNEQLVEIGMKCEDLQLDCMLEDLALKIANSKFNQPKKKTSESYKLYQNFYTSLEQVEVIVEEMKVCYELMLEELNIDNGEPVRLSKSTLFEIYLRQQPDLQVVK